MKPIKYVLLLFAICLIMLQGCQSNNIYHSPMENKLPDDWDGGLLSQQPCQSPCFDSIIPGTSDRVAVANVIQGKIYEQNCEFPNNLNIYGADYFSCDGMFIRFNSNIVDYVMFNPSRKITLGDVIQKYGKPTAVWLGKPYETLANCLCVNFSNNKIWLSLQYQTDNSYPLIYLLEKSSTVVTVSYYSDFDTFKLTQSIDEISVKQAWQGYGEYGQSEKDFKDTTIIKRERWNHWAPIVLVFGILIVIALLAYLILDIISERSSKP